jgi:hypothetical protein
MQVVTVVTRLFFFANLRHHLSPLSPPQNSFGALEPTRIIGAAHLGV